MKRLEGAYALAMIFADEEALCHRRAAGQPAGGRLRRRASLSGLGRVCAGALHQPRRLSRRRRCGGDARATRSRSTTREAVPPIARSRSPALRRGLVDKGGYRHFMAKEIHEQPEVIGHTLAHYVDPVARAVALRENGAAEALAKATRLTISACGTAYYAGLIGKYWFEKMARLPSKSMSRRNCAIAQPVYPEGGAALFISQSGETADTLAALRDAKDTGPDDHRRSSMCRKARSRAKPTSCCRPLPGRKSASPRPKPSPASWRCWPPCDRGRRGARAY